MELASVDLIARAENAELLWLSGVGKPPLARATGHTRPTGLPPDPPDGLENYSAAIETSYSAAATSGRSPISIFSDIEEGRGAGMHFSRRYGRATALLKNRSSHPEGG